jgi:hypothetical protein
MSSTARNAVKYASGIRINYSEKLSVKLYIHWVISEITFRKVGPKIRSRSNPNAKVWIVAHMTVIYVTKCNMDIN